MIRIIPVMSSLQVFPVTKPYGDTPPHRYFNIFESLAPVMIAYKILKFY